MEVKTGGGTYWEGMMKMVLCSLVVGAAEPGRGWGGGAGELSHTTQMVLTKRQVDNLNPRTNLVLQ